MAREPKNKAAQAGPEQEEMTVVILRFKGGGQTLQKGFDAVNQALSALGPTTASHRRHALPSPTTADAPRGAEVVAEDGEASDPEVASDVLDSQSEYAEPVTESVQHNGEAARKPSKPKFDSSLDLSAGSVAFKDYCEQKQPGTDNDRYLVAAAWLANHGGHAEFSASQLFTCFRAMGWNEQVDFMQPVRKMKQKKSYFERTSERNWKLTQVGMAAAEAIAPKIG